MIIPIYINGGGYGTLPSFIFYPYIIFLFSVLIYCIIQMYNYSDFKPKFENWLFELRYYKALKERRDRKRFINSIKIEEDLGQRLLDSKYWRKK